MCFLCAKFQLPATFHSRLRGSGTGETDGQTDGETDGQTDRQQPSMHYASPHGAGHNNEKQRVSLHEKQKKNTEYPNSSTYEKSCARGDTIFLRPMQVDNIFVLFARWDLFLYVLAI